MAVLRLDVKAKHLRSATANGDKYCYLSLELEKLRLSYYRWTEVKYKFSKDSQILVVYRTSVPVQVLERLQTPFLVPFLILSNLMLSAFRKL